MTRRHRARNLSAIAALLTCMLMATVPVCGQSLEPVAGFFISARDSLRGLPGVQVVVEPLRAEPEQDGLTQVALRADVEARLRKAGVRIFPSAAEASITVPILYVHVNAGRSTTGVYAYSIAVELTQVVRSLLTAAEFTGVTWSRSSLGIIGVSQLPQVKNTVGDYVDALIVDWLAVQPKP